MTWRWKWIVGIAAILFVLSVTGCNKKKSIVIVPTTPQVEAPATPQPPAPPVALSVAEPVNVVPPPSVPEPPAPAALSMRERLAKEVQDAYFDFDKSDLRPDAREAVTRDADALKAILRDFPTTNAIVEGHCDERGSAEYNMALGDRRATVAKAFLGDLGVPVDRLLSISYGKERPQCTESNEECWQRNRRVHFVQGEDQRKTISQNGTEAGLASLAGN